MGVLDTLLRAFGLLGFERKSIDGVQCHWRKDLQPVGEDDVPAGELVELVATLSVPNTFVAAPKVRFDILEEDAFLTGGWDDPVVSLVGTGASAPADFPVAARTTGYVELQEGETFAGAVEQFKRSHQADYDTRILAATDTSSMTSWLVAWWRAQRLEDFLGAEMYFLLTLEDGRVASNDAVMNVDDGPPGTAARLTGRVLDSNPLDPGTPEPVPGTELRLAGRTARTGLDGAFVIDARLNVGSQQLAVRRPGIDPVVLTVDVAQAAGSRLAVTVRDAGGTTLKTVTTPGAPDPAAAVACPLGDIKVVVHKLRGTVTWPDSRDGTAAYTGTPLSERRVFALPLEPGATAAQRPKTTAAWAALGQRPGVLRSHRPGRWADDEATDADGEWEIRLLDLSLGRSHLLWVESPDPDVAGETSPDYLVRTFHTDLTRFDTTVTALGAVAVPGNQMNVVDPAGLAVGQKLVVGDSDEQEEIKVRTIAGNTVNLVVPTPPPVLTALRHRHEAGEIVVRSTTEADQLATEGRHLIDHTFNLKAATDADCVAWGSEVLRVVDWEADPAHPDPDTTDIRVIRPARGAPPAGFDATPIGGATAVDRLTFDPAQKVVSGIELRALPLVPVFGAAEDRSGAARRAANGLAAGADGPFPRGHLDAEVRFVLDTRRIDSGVDLDDPPPPAWDDANADARRCDLLEQTWIVTPALPGRILPPPNAISGVTDAFWIHDAVSLADGAFAWVPNPRDPGRTKADAVVAFRELRSPWVPVLAAVTPRILGFATGRTLLLAPGHGFYSDVPAGGPAPRAEGAATAAPADRPNWKSFRSGFHWSAGEDDNTVLMARELDRIARGGGLQVATIREVRDLLKIGVAQVADNNFTDSQRADFLRLWQQNPVYYLGAQPAAAVIGGVQLRGAVIGQDAGVVDQNKEHDGINARINLARQLAAAGNLDVFFAVHTNAVGGRGTFVMYLNLTGGVPAIPEQNTIGQSLATHVGQEIRERCHTWTINAALDGWSLSENQGGGVGDLQSTFDYWSQLQPGVESQNRPRRLTNVPGDVPAWEHKAFPSRVRVALAEVAFHSRSDDAALLRRGWFRRTAGEAMAFGIEAGLRDAWPAALGAEPRPLTQADLVAMFAATFGRTAQVAALPAGGGAVAAGAIAAAVTAVTGVPSAAAGTGLETAVTAIEAARDAYKRDDLLTALRDAFATVAGYPAGHADIDTFVTGRITLGGADVRSAKPPTRAEAGAWVAAGTGMRPRTLAKVIATPRNGVSLMTALAGDAAADRFVPRNEGVALANRIRALRRQDIYSAEAVYLADRLQDRLDTAPPLFEYSVGWDEEVTVVADMAGVAWRLETKDISFAISDGKGFKKTLGATLRAAGQLGSEGWRVQLPRRASDAYTLEVFAKPTGAADPLRLGGQTVRIGHR